VAQRLPHLGRKLSLTRKVLLLRLHSLAHTHPPPLTSTGQFASLYAAHESPIILAQLLLDSNMLLSRALLEVVPLSDETFVPCLLDFFAARGKEIDLVEHTIGLEVKATSEYQLFLRGRSPASKVLTTVVKMYSAAYVDRSIRWLVDEITQQDEVRACVTVLSLAAAPGSSMFRCC
jgi:hypothetical protein